MASLARALRLASQTPSLRTCVVQPVRNSTGGQGHIVSIPCRNKPSKAELTILGSVMLVCWLTIPTWVLLHVKEYNGTVPPK